MNEKLLKDYLEQNGRLFGDDIKIEDIIVDGNLVMFREVYDQLNFNQHTIYLLDIIAWVYSKVKEG